MVKNESLFHLKVWSNDIVLHPRETMVVYDIIAPQGTMAFHCEKKTDFRILNPLNQRMNMGN